MEQKEANEIAEQIVEQDDETITRFKFGYLFSIFLKSFEILWNDSLKLTMKFSDFSKVVFINYIVFEILTVILARLNEYIKFKSV